MSPAEFNRDSTNPATSGTSVPVPPPAPTSPRAAPATVPPAAAPAAAPDRQVGGRTVAGVDADRGVRWRGELTTVDPHAGAAPASTDEGQQPNQAIPNPDRVAREAPPWLVSLVFHLILLLALALITTPVGSSVGTVMLSIGQSSEESPVELAEFSISEIDAISDSEMPEDFETEVVSVFDTAQLSEIDTLTPVENDVGLELVGVQPMFDGRRGAMKAALMAMYGGTPETQDAVKLGLEWLQRQQTRKGCWNLNGPYSDGGIVKIESAATAMALLAFLADGHTHQDGEYAEVVKKGIDYLIDHQDRQGFFANDARRHERMYAQAQATIALCELYGMTKDSWLRPRAQLAIDFAVKAQSPEGGWRYDIAEDSDTSVTGWFVMAIKSAQAAELEVDRYVLLNVDKFLDTVQTYGGAAYAYQPRGNPSPAMTAEGLLCRQYIGWPRERAQLRQGIDALLLDSPFDLADRDVYYWYYATQVMHHYGGAPWKAWNDVMRVQLPEAQVKQGRERGSWSPQNDPWGRNFGRLYTTCLSLYCLEVYYRHMPLYQPKN